MYTESVDALFCMRNLDNAWRR